MSAIASRSTTPAGGDKRMEAMTLVGHENSFYYAPDGREMDNENPFAASVCYFPDGKHMISASGDKTTRIWDLEAGKEIEEARVVREQEVCAVAVSRDGHWVITAGGDFRAGPGVLEAREVDTGIIKRFDGHSREVTCIDISMDSKQLASGSRDGAARIWSLATGELVAGPFEHGDWISAVRFSKNSKKLAVRGPGKALQVWDIQTQKLDRRVGNSSGREVVFFIPTPVFWTAKDRTIVTAFAFNTESRLSDTIYEFDSSTLETVGTPFEGHTHHVTGLALSFDYALLTSASYFEGTIKLWAFESRQLLASFNQDGPKFLVLSPDSRQLAYMTHDGPPKIYICSIPLETLNTIWPTRQAPSISAPKNTHNSDPLNSDATTRPAAERRHRATMPFATQRLRPSPIVHQQSPTILRHLRKLLPSSFRRGTVLPVRNDEPYDPLDVPATSSQHHNLSHSTQGMSEVHPGMIPGENSRPVLALPITQSFRPSSRLSLSNWWPLHASHTPAPVVDVPLAQGKLRHAAADAPKANDDEYVRDEDFDPTSLPNSNLQRASTLVPTNGGEHGSGRSCLCF